MRKFARTLACAGAAAVLGLAFTPSPASATDSYHLSCDTTGATGDLEVQWSNGATSQPVVFSVSDALSDGHAVEIRIIGRNQVDTPLSWPWHKVTAGWGHGQSWASTATYSGGIYDIGLEVARYSGTGTIMNHCTSSLKDGI
ncbi:hypothetical protein ACFVXE_24860 [Streptomyces sp. NPDC058231]|uniref:hypothetical protein n=1 Tax=Streptomyces sp. NPDC058231 TaxID=3346392 RepID=UPI0036E48040